jgi:hypothetical protein
MSGALVSSPASQPGSRVALGQDSSVIRPVRAVAHVHSEWSDDGSWSLSRIAQTFARRRCSIVLMCEHSRGFSSAKWTDYIEACSAASDKRITLIPGIEYGDEDDVVHIPVWGQVPFFGEAPPIGTLLGQVTEVGGTAVWAHPWRRDAWLRADPSWYKQLHAVEVWNRKYDGIAPNARGVELSRRHEVPPFVALDFHTRRQLFPLRLTLNLAAGPSPAATGVTPDHVYAALQAGQFSPRALGLPLSRLTDGAPAEALRVLESARRALARALRPHS